jgi:hypothetical protein
MVERFIRKELQFHGKPANQRTGRREGGETTAGPGFTVPIDGRQTQLISYIYIYMYITYVYRNHICNIIENGHSNTYMA